MGPEIFLAFFAFLGIIFWGIVRVIWWVIKKFLDLVFIPWMWITNYIRVHAWGIKSDKSKGALHKLKSPISYKRPNKITK